MKLAFSSFFLFVCFVFETGSFYIVQVGLELVILLTHPPEDWNYRYRPQHLGSIQGFFLLYKSGKSTVFFAGLKVSQSETPTDY
jgi:hypothetical protein